MGNVSDALQTCRYIAHCQLPIANCLLTKEAPVETGADHIRKSSVSAMKKIDKVNGV
jgi:hypothetical protein